MEMTKLLVLLLLCCTVMQLACANTFFSTGWRGVRAGRQKRGELMLASAEEHIFKSQTAQQLAEMMSDRQVRQAVCLLLERSTEEHVSVFQITRVSSLNFRILNLLLSFPNFHFNNF